MSRGLESRVKVEGNPTEKTKCVRFITFSLSVRRRGSDSKVSTRNMEKRVANEYMGLILSLLNIKRKQEYNM